MTFGSAGLAIDVGGTFTDVVLRDETGSSSVAKVLTTPDDPIAAIVSGVTRLVAEPARIGRVVHATTLATNAVLEGGGARVAFVTTRGFRSMIPLGRYARVEEDRYDLRFTPPVLDAECFEVTERTGSRGEVLVPLDPESVRQAAREITARGLTSAAVCLLHSYANPAHEERVAAILRESVPHVVTSAEVWPEIREYERATTTLVSARVGPLMAAYLTRLGEALRALGITAPVYVMDSGGGVVSAPLAARRAVVTIESGPAAGALMAARYGEAVSFDMGGTTAKACVIRAGRPAITREFHVGGKGSFGGRRAGTGIPIRTPAIDLAEVGAGGGSIAWLDPAGSLRVGPVSAGSSPGPACYGLGGLEPTVTDADLVLGYLGAASLPLDPLLAAKALDRLAAPLGVGRAAAAHAVHEIVNAAMASAVHVVTVQRGIDPRGFALVAFGGAGPVHACRIAERFGIGHVIVPPLCGVASAAGLLAGPLATSRVRTRLGAADPEAIFAELARSAADDLEVGLDDPGVSVSRAVDVRFHGQSHDLTVDWSESRAELAARFRARYREVYGIDQEGEIEVVSYRVRLARDFPAAPVVAAEPQPPPAARRRDAYFPELGGYVATPVLTRAEADGVRGPAIVEDPGSTLVIPPGWQAGLAADSSLHLHRRPA
ncbi:hydantoinase/oxoprolinase family protein [Nonomuraea sp. NPDC050310]|uniref:hydantoinase/oxoprolinase family protein n=1 Tax=Nonomuraea sp. NPDC050310 TaxID=3154935 RepID=UPI0033EF3303